MLRALLIVFFAQIRACPVLEKCTCTIIPDNLNFYESVDCDGFEDGFFGGFGNNTRALRVSNLNNSDVVCSLIGGLVELPELQTLTLVGCDLSNVTFDVGVRDFVLSGNQLESVPEFANASQLLMLDLSHNLITVLDGGAFRGLEGLELLNLSSNSLTIIEQDSLTHLVNLKCLDLSSNNLTRLDDKILRGVNNLQYLNLSRNVLEVLDEVSFGALTKLRQLDVSWNRLARVAPGSLELPSLSRLLLAGNPQLEVLVGSGHRLQTLDASRTGLKQVPSALTHSIRTLRLAGNSIKIIRCGDLDSYPLLQLLDFTANELTGIEDDALGRLETLSILYLTDNNIGSIPRSLPEHLTVLHLEHNIVTKISNDDLEGLTSLEVLLLNDNKIRTIEQTAFIQLTSLIALDLSRNPLISLEPGSLTGPLQVLRLSSINIMSPAKDATFPLSTPEQLISLDLSGSPGLARQFLTDIAALAASKALQELDISKTTTRTIRSDLFHYLPQLRLLHIRNNDIDCEGLNWLATWMRGKDSPEYGEIRCNSPPELWGTLLVDLPTEVTTINNNTPSLPNKKKRKKVYVNRKLVKNITSTSTSPTPSMAMYTTTEVKEKHPGVWILGITVLGMVALLVMLAARFTRSRRRHLQQDIEVSSLPGVTELW